VLLLNVDGLKNYHILKQKVLSNTFPWYLEKYGDGKVTPFEFLTHTILKRGEDKPNSFIYEDVLNFLLELSSKYKFKINEIYRIAFNLTYPCGLKTSGIHADHSFDHKSIIFYFSNCKDQLGTIIYKEKINENEKNTFKNDKNLTILNTIRGEEDTGFMFNGQHFHEALFPKNDKRIVLVVTFK
jgi:hypothetical protein